jgi:hypothetical protein
MMQSPNSPRKRATTSDVGADDGTLEGRVELPMTGSRKRNRLGSGDNIGGRESLKPSFDSPDTIRMEGPSNLASEENKTTERETKCSTVTDQLALDEGLISSSGGAALHPPDSSSRSNRGRLKEETAARETADNPSRISHQGELCDPHEPVEVGNSDDVESRSSEPQDKASLLYTDNIMAAAAATNELASAGMNFSFPGDGGVDGGVDGLQQQQISTGRDDLSAMSAASLLNVATSQILINQLIYQNAELRHRNFSLHQELEKVKQQVASVLRQLMMVQQRPNLHIQPSTTADPDTDFLRRKHPGLAGGEETRSMNTGMIQSATHGQNDGPAHGAFRDVASSELAQCQQQPAMASAATSLLNQYLNQLMQPQQDEQQQQHALNQQQQQVVLSQLFQRILSASVAPLSSPEFTPVHQGQQQHDSVAHYQRLMGNLAAGVLAPNIGIERPQTNQQAEGKEETGRKVEDRGGSTNQR